MTNYEAVRCMIIVIAVVLIISALILAPDTTTPIGFGLLLIIVGFVLALMGFQPWNWPRR